MMELLHYINLDIDQSKYPLILYFLRLMRDQKYAMGFL